MPNNNRDFSPRIGEIYFMEFDGVGSEQAGWRPGLVFQNNVGNKYSPNIIALPLTSSNKKSNQPTHVCVRSEDTGLLRDSIVLCENPQRMSKHKIGRYITTLPDSYMKKIACANLVTSAAISYLEPETVLEAWMMAVSLNRA